MYITVLGSWTNTKLYKWNMKTFQFYNVPFKYVSDDTLYNFIYSYGKKEMFAPN